MCQKKKTADKSCHGTNRTFVPTAFGTIVCTSLTQPSQYLTN